MTSDSSMRTFDGSEDVARFFFNFEQVLAKGKTTPEKAEMLLSHLDAAAFDYFYRNFSAKNALLPAAKDYEEVKRQLLEHFGKPSDLQDDIRSAVEAKLDPGDLRGSMKQIERLYQMAEFNDEAKFGMLRQAVTYHRQLSQFCTLRGVQTY